MNILVFGKDGQLGKAFKTVFNVNKLDKFHRITYVSRAECDLGNLVAITAILDRLEPNLIINAAAYTAVDKAETEVDLAYAINAKAPEAMAVYARRHGATFLHYSTDYVFDGSKKSPYEESDIPNPLGVYGKSKSAGEAVIENAFNSNQDSLTESNKTKHANLNPKYAILRTSWLYGEGDNFIRKILRLAKERQTLKVIADQYGVPTNANWLAKVSLALVLNEEHQLRPFPSGIYHAVPLGQTSWHGLACYAVQVAADAGVGLKQRPEEIEAVSAVNFPMIAPRPMNSRLDAAKIQQVLLGQGNQSTIGFFDQLWRAQVADYVNQCIATDIL
jgi:dTDP-4-dehydrorhamnose reductase